MSQILFDNAVIWGGVCPRPMRGCMLVRDGVIADIGTGAPPPGTDVRDLAGQHVLPGFVDAHSHLTVAAWMPRTIDASGWTSTEQLLAAVAHCAPSQPDDGWMLAMDADLDRLGGRLPHPDDLDRASARRPVLVADFTLHRSLASSAALRLLGSDGSPWAADIDRRAGRPTGMIWESAHAAAFRLALESLAHAIGDHGRAALLEGEAERHLACGITACHDPCVPPSLTGALEVLRTRTPLRLSWSMVAEAGMLEPATPSEICGCCGEGPSSAKLFMDGAHRCALCLNPGHVLHMMGRAASAAFRGDLGPISSLTSYKSVYRGGMFHMPYLRMDTNELAGRLEALASRGVRPKIHAVGNLASASAAQALAYAGSPEATLEHVAFLSDRDIDHIATTNAVVSMQPGFIDRFGAGVLDRGLTPRLRAYPTASLRRAGVAVALSSDHPCGPLAPLANIRTSVLREAPDGRRVDAREALTLPEAVEAYTILGHRAIHGHPGKGLSPGAVADFVVVSGEPLAATTHVRQTWIGGRLAWTKSGGLPERFG